MVCDDYCDSVTQTLRLTHCVFSQQQDKISSSAPKTHVVFFEAKFAALLSFQNPFTKDCGSDEVCISDLVLSVTTDTKATR